MTFGRFLMQALDTLSAKFFDPKAASKKLIKPEELEQTKRTFFHKKMKLATSKLINLSARSSYFIDDISKHNVLIVVLHANLLPLNILSQANVISEKRM